MAQETSSWRPSGHTRIPPGSGPSTVSPEAAKLDEGARGVNFPWRATLSLASLLVLSGCVERPRPAPVDAGAYWPAYLGNSARTPFLDEVITNRPPVIVWSAGVGSGFQGMPVVTDEAVLAASSDRYVQALSRQDGSTFWRKRLDGPPVSPLVVGDVVYAATQQKGYLRAFRVDDGTDIWKRSLPSTRKPVFLAGDTAYVASEESVLFAFGRQNIPLYDDPVWYALLPQPPTAGPVVIGDWVAYVAADSVFLLSRISGLRLTSAHSSGVLVGEAAADSTALYLATEDGSLISWHLPNLHVLWQTSGFGSFIAGPVVAGSDGYAVTRAGRLIRFNTSTGAAEVIADCRGTVTSSPVVVRNGVLVGTLGGKLHFYSRDGVQVWEKELDGSIEAPVFVHEGRILVALYGKVGGFMGSPYGGKLVELR